MANPYSRKQRNKNLEFLTNIGDGWTAIFEGNRKFYSAAYFDLLTGVWQKGEVTKSEALGLIKAIRSSSSISKCLSAAIRNGFLIEHENPYDKRSQFVRLSPAMKKKVDKFFDDNIDEIKELLRYIEKVETQI